MKWGVSIMVHNDCSKCKKVVRMSVSMSADTHNTLSGLAAEFHRSKASIVRHAVEKRLNYYLSNVRYIDHDQAERIHKTATEIADNCRLILSNIRRIGFNYNQDLRLKNAKNKYLSIMRSSTISYSRMEEAKDEYEKAKSEIEKICLNKEELHDLFTRFESVAEEMRVLTCLIHE